MNFFIKIDTTNKNEKIASVCSFSNKIPISTAIDEDISNAIIRAIEEAQVKIFDLTKIEPNPGPGSFTGIKMGITFANTYNWAKDLISGGTPKVNEYKPNYGKEPNIN